MRLNRGHSGDATREALVRAASDAFARRGFHETTVREICKRARANVAAVNYHFGGKQGLYVEALMPCRGEGPSEQWAPPATDSAPPEKRLEAFVRSFFERLVGRDSDANHAALMAREMIEPTAALDAVVSRYIRPQADWLREVVEELIGPGATAEATGLACMSVVGQILFYKHCAAVVDRLNPALSPNPDTLERHVRHVTEFTLAALRGLTARPSTRPAQNPRPETLTLR